MPDTIPTFKERYHPGEFESLPLEYCKGYEGGYTACRDLALQEAERLKSSDEALEGQWAEIARLRAALKGADQIVKDMLEYRDEGGDLPLGTCDYYRLEDHLKISAVALAEASPPE